MPKTVKIPWAAWRDPDYLELSFPDAWDVTTCRMKGSDAPELTLEQIRTELLNPIGTARLSDLAIGKEKIVIAVDDLTRTTPVSKIMPVILEEFEKAGITDDKITILLALGAHRPMNREDRIKKLGKEVVERINIENHHPYENLTNVGNSNLGTPIEINTTYYTADLKIAVGGVIPHPLAGFGGGAKIILPGVCGMNTLEANHSAGIRGIGVGIGVITALREDIEDIAKKVGLDFSINVVFNEIGNIAGITAGDFILAHRNAIELANDLYRTEITKENMICFLNAYPEDTELNQAYKGLNCLMTAPSSLIDKKGAVVLMASCYEGRGYHALLSETGSRLFTNFGDNILWKGLIRRRKVYMLCPNISKSDLIHLFPSTILIFKEWEGLIKKLEEDFGPSPKAVLFPTSIQLCNKEG